MAYETTSFTYDVDTLRAAGINLPKPVVDQYDLIQTVRTARPSDDLAITLQQDVTAGKVRKTDVAKRITDAATARLIADQAGPIAAGVERSAALVGVAALRTAESSVIDQLRPRFDAAARVIVEAVGEGITETTTAEEAVRTGSRAAAYAQLAGAADDLNNVRNLLARVVGVVGVEWFIDPSNMAASPNYGTNLNAGGFSGYGRAVNAFEQPALAEGAAFATSAPLPPAAPWVALVRRGFTLHLNQRAEVELIRANEDAARAA